MSAGGTKRVRAIGGSEATPGVATRSGKKYITNHPTVMAEGQSTPLPENNETTTMGQGEEEHPQVLFWAFLYLMTQIIQMKMRSQKS